MNPPSILTIVGARPQFIKAAVLSRLIRTSVWRDRFTEYLVHTGQHYDANMSEVFFREMQIPPAEVNLGISGGGHGEMTGEMLRRIEQVLLERTPDYVLVYGDTNSTLAGALAAAKLHIPVVHVEAGLRSANMAMPEEVNRVLTDHIAAVLFCPSPVAVQNLAQEGIPKQLTRHSVQRVHNVGDIMYDASLFYRDLASRRPADHGVLVRHGIRPGYVLVTVHRAENTDDPERMQAIASAINRRTDHRFVFPVHPRTRKILTAMGYRPAEHVQLIDPVGYLDMLELESSCSIVMTDSGGVQKEAYYFQKPCITLREETEWVETVQAGWNTLVGADLQAISNALAHVSTPLQQPDFYGDGSTAGRILEILTNRQPPFR